MLLRIIFPNKKSYKRLKKYNNNLNSNKPDSLFKNKIIQNIKINNLIICTCKHNKKLLKIF